MTAAASKPLPTLEGRIVLVTGANGGMGEQFVWQALKRGAAKIYAAARTPKDWPDVRIQPLALDITDANAVAHAAATAPDVDLLINNAAIAPTGDTLFGPEGEAHRIFETNFFGTLRVANAFAPVLAAKGGGTLVNVLSSSAWISLPTVYAASKAAAWSATNGLRFALEAQGTQVVGVLVGMIDTPMSAHFNVPKSSPASVVAEVYDGIAAGVIEVIADDQTRDLKSRLSTKAEELYPWLHGALRAFLGS
ncbi:MULTISPECIES: SDR family oxidoreductase [unclassified Acidiphilium]|uniref:SDR family oxidoreductase n=1 Tax=unclassified Acidiphilium TaxID=2617493 RepID=UPI0004611F43|nr:MULTISPECIES: SDR family oxidoreductase [unclassified Acidiphilium]KDM68757.1 short-chain dehydrogenase/reductase SDR [Acidiphilium sp. JA12-A1]